MLSPMPDATMCFRSRRRLRKEGWGLMQADTRCSLSTLVND